MSRRSFMVGITLRPFELTSRCYIHLDWGGCKYQNASVAPRCALAPGPLIRTLTRTTAGVTSFGAHGVRRASVRTLAIPSGPTNKHETWRDENEVDNLPKVRRRDGTLADIDKTRGFVDYYRNPDPYRDPLEVKARHPKLVARFSHRSFMPPAARVRLARAERGRPRRGRTHGPGGQVHGLRHAVLPDPHWLPCQQPDSRVESPHLC